MDTHDREPIWAVPDVSPLMVAGAGGVRVAAYEWGNPDGKEILLIHGVAQCHLCFAPQIASDLAREVEHTIAFLDACYHLRPASALYERALCYNAIVPMAVRRAAAAWHTDPAETIAALRKVRVPTLVTQGTRDTIVLPEAARMTAQAIPHARISWYEECGHSPFQEYPERFNRELAAFVRET